MQDRYVEGGYGAFLRMPARLTTGLALAPRNLLPINYYVATLYAAY